MWTSDSHILLAKQKISLNTNQFSEKFSYIKACIH